MQSLLEGLVEQRQLAQRDETADGAPRHPYHRPSRHQQGGDACAQFGEGLPARQRQSLRSQAAAQRSIARLKILAQPEQPQLGGGLAGRQQPVVIPGAPFIGGRAEPPLMLPRRVPQHHPQRRQSAHQQRPRQPQPKRNQHRAHGRQRDPVLHQAAQCFEQRHGPVRSLRPRPVKVIVEVRGLVKRQVRGGRLAMNQRRNVILHQFRLRRSHPLGDTTQDSGQQQQAAQRDGRWQGGPQRGRIAVSAKYRHRAIDHRAREIYRGRRQEALHYQQNRPRRGPRCGSLPHQRERARHIGELRGQLAEPRSVNRRRITQKPMLPDPACGRISASQPLCPAPIPPRDRAPFRRVVN